MRSMFSNAYHALPAEQKAMVMAKETCRLVVMECPMYAW